MKKDHSGFIAAVTKYVSENPEVSPYVTEAVADGVRAALSESLSRAADMEVALTVALTKRLKRSYVDALVLSKLKKWNGRSAINWDSTIAELSGNERDE